MSLQETCVASINRDKTWDVAMRPDPFGQIETSRVIDVLLAW